jgi:hypothetical protein
MFEKIIPPEKGPAAWLSQDVRKVLFWMFALLGRGIAVAGGIVAIYTSPRKPPPFEVSITVLIVGAVFILIGEYFRVEDGA